MQYTFYLLAQSSNNYYSTTIRHMKWYSVLYLETQRTIHFIENYSVLLYINNYLHIHRDIHRGISIGVMKSRMGKYIYGCHPEHGP